MAILNFIRSTPKVDVNQKRAVIFIRLALYCFSSHIIETVLSQQQLPPDNYYHPPRHNLAVPFAISTSTYSPPNDNLLKAVTAASSRQKKSANFFDYRPPSLLTTLFGGDTGSLPPHLRPQQVVNKVSCTFEHSMCGWRQLMSPTDHFDWFRHSGPVGVNLLQPNIRGDHTTGYGAFMLLTTPPAPIVSPSTDVIVNPASSGTGALTGSSGIAGGAATAGGAKAAARAPDPEIEPEDMLMQRMLSGQYGGNGMGGGMGMGNNFGFNGMPNWFGGGFSGAGLSSGGLPPQSDPATANIMALLYAAAGGNGGRQTNNGHQMSQLTMHQLFKRQAPNMLDTAQPASQTYPQTFQGPTNADYNYSPPQHHQQRQVPSQQRTAAQNSLSHGGTRVLEPHEVLAAFKMANVPHLQMQPQQQHVPLPTHHKVDSAAAQFQQQPQMNYIHPQQAMMLPSPQSTQQYPPSQPPSQSLPLPQFENHPGVQHYAPLPPSASAPNTPGIVSYHAADFHQPSSPSLSHNRPQRPQLSSPHRHMQPMPPHVMPPSTMFMPPPLPSQQTSYGPPPTSSGYAEGMPPPQQHRQQSFDTYPTPPMVASANGLMPMIPGYNTQQNTASAPTVQEVQVAATAPAAAGGGQQQVVVSPHPNPFAEQSVAANGQQANVAGDFGTSANHESPYHPIAQLISPPIYVDGEQINGTFSFWYHLRGAFGRITVYKRHLDHFVPDETLWEVVGHQSWKWEQAVIQLYTQQQQGSPSLLHIPTTVSNGGRNMPFQIIIEGSLKAGVLTFIGLDDVVLDGEEGPPPTITAHINAANNNNNGIPQNNVVFIEPSNGDGVPVPIAPPPIDSTTTQASLRTSPPKQSPGVLKPQLPIYPNHDPNRLGPGLMGPTTEDPMSRRHKLLFGIRPTAVEDETLPTTIASTSTNTTYTTKQPTILTSTPAATTIAPFTVWYPPAAILPAAKPEFLYASGEKASGPTPVTNQSSRAKKLNKVQPKTSTTTVTTDAADQLPQIFSAGFAPSSTPISTKPQITVLRNAVVAKPTYFSSNSGGEPATPPQPVPMRFKSSNTNVVQSGNVGVSLSLGLEREEIPGVPLLTATSFPTTTNTTTTEAAKRTSAASIADKTTEELKIIAASRAAAADVASVVEQPNTEITLATLFAETQRTTVIVETTVEQTTSPSITVNVTDLYFTEIYNNTMTTDVTFEFPSDIAAAVTELSNTSGTNHSESTFTSRSLAPLPFDQPRASAVNTSLLPPSTTPATTVGAPLTLTSPTTPAYQAYIEALRRSIMRSQEQNKATSLHDKDVAAVGDQAAMLNGVAYSGDGVMMMDALPPVIPKSSNSSILTARSVSSTKRDVMLLLNGGRDPTSPFSSHAALTMPNDLSPSIKSGPDFLVDEPATASAVVLPAVFVDVPSEQQNIGGNPISVPLNSAAQVNIDPRSGVVAGGVSSQNGTTLPKAVIVFGMSFAGFVILSLLLIGLQQAAYNPLCCSRAPADRHYYNDSQLSAQTGGNCSVPVSTESKQIAGRTHSGITQASFDIYESVRGAPGGDVALGPGVGPRAAGPRAESSASSQVYFSSWSQRGCRFQPNEYAGSTTLSSTASETAYENNIVRAATVGGKTGVRLLYDNYNNSKGSQQQPVMSSKQWKSAPKIAANQQHRNSRQLSGLAKELQPIGSNDFTYDNNNRKSAVPRVQSSENDKKRTANKFYENECSAAADVGSRGIEEKREVFGTHKIIKQHQQLDGHYGAECKTEQHNSKKDRIIHRSVAESDEISHGLTQIVRSGDVICSAL